MATVAARAPKRELAPDWRDALRDAVRRLAIRTWGTVLVALSFAGAAAFATHNPTDPSLSTAAGGPPTNWLGSAGAYFSDALFLLFGLGAVLLLPVIGIAGISDDATAARGPRRTRASPGGGWSGVAGDRSQPDERLVRLRTAGGLGRGSRPRSGARRGCRRGPDWQSVDRWADAADASPAFRHCRPRARLSCPRA